MVKSNLSLFLCLFIDVSMNAQICTNELPPSFNYPQHERLEQSVTSSINLTPPDLAQALAEDEESEQIGLPYRISLPIDVNIAIDKDGEWSEVSGDMNMWRCGITAKGAYGLTLCYDKFWLPEGAKFFIYSKDKSRSLGAFTSLNNKEGVRDNPRPFATSFVEGDDIVLEYYEPKNMGKQGVISVLRVGYIYKPLTIFRIKADGIFERAIGQSLSCNINVNCSEGQNWQNQKRAVALITDIFNGTLCTGALINNTKNDGRQLFLTADHCLPDGYDSWGGGKTDLNFWLFYWNYESPSCSNVTDVPMPSAQGAKILSNFSFTDYALLEITDNLNYVQGYRPYFCGWGGKLFIRGGSVCIHHPKGDIKKIAISTEAIIDTNHDPLNWVGGDTSPILTHYVVNFTKGTAEPGSSGAPLFNMEGNIMGQLHGGNTSCPPITKYFGSLPVGMKNSSGPMLINFLDPINGNAEQCAGLSR